MSSGRRTISLDEATYEALIAHSLYDPRPLREIVREIIRAHVDRARATPSAAIDGEESLRAAE
jgi:hypothetical protein